MIKMSRPSPNPTPSPSISPSRLRDTAPKLWWEDFAPGETIVTGAITVTESHVVSWAALTGDWVPLHVDEEYASRTQFGGRIAHGPLTYALALGLMTQTHAYDNVVAWLGTDNLRAVAPVMLGDTVRATGTVVTYRETSRDDRGVVGLGFDVTNQDGVTVMTFENTVLMPRRPAGAEESEG